MISGTDVQLNDDSYSGIISIGFDFCYFGVNYNKLLIASNSYVTFDTSQAMGYSPWVFSSDLPSAGAPMNSIFGPWQDVNPALGGSVRYATYGLAPYRKFVVSFYDTPMFSCTDVLFRNQIVLYESLNIIDINIESRQLCGTWNNGFGIEGIIGLDTTEAYVVPGRNHSDSWTSNGDCYRFIPQCYCAAPADMMAGDVTGSTYWDYDQDCTQDVGEPGMPNVRFDVQPGNGTVWSGYQGNMAFMVDPGAYSMQFSGQNPWYMNSACPSGPVAVDVVANSTAGPFDWGLDITPYQDLVVNVGSGWMAACFNSSQSVQLCNNGNIPAQNVALSVTLPAFLLDVNASIAPTTSGDTLGWVFPWIGPGECVTINLTDSVDCDPNLVGQLACVNAWASVDTSEVETVNNADEWCMEVAASYDPNAVYVRVAETEQTPFVTDHLITGSDRLEYIVHFQNTGNAPAYNVSVHQPLPQWVDAATLVPGASSHFCTPHMADGMLMIDFPAIILPDSMSDPMGSQGWFRFTIEQAPGNGPGTDIPGVASIYFDNNPAVVTNTAHSVIMVVGTDGMTSAAPILVPNPADGIVRLNGVNEPLDLDVTDLNGRVVYSRSAFQGGSLDLSHLEAGMYLVRGVGSTVSFTERLMLK